MVELHSEYGMKSLLNLKIRMESSQFQTQIVHYIYMGKMMKG